jgi:flagellar basal-body rod protein FlgG
MVALARSGTVVAKRAATTPKRAKMQTGYYSGTAGMVAGFNHLNVIANNLANANTAGFKEDRLIIGDYSRIHKNAQDELAIKNHTKDAASYLNRAMTKTPQVVREYSDFSLGSIQRTDNSLDLAISKEGYFFLVQTPEGVKLTRDGTLKLAEDGTLVTKDGHAVLPSNYFESNQPIRFNPQDSVVTIDPDGRVYTNANGGVEMLENSQLFIVKPKDLNLLVKEGGNLYSYAEDVVFEPTEDSSAIKQGFVEKSNVNTVKMMSELIEVNRLVQMYQKVMDTQMNEINREAIDKVSKRA